MDQWLAGCAIPDLDTADEHVAAAPAAGFEDAELQDYTWSTERSLRRLYKLACIATPIDWTLYRLGGTIPGECMGNIADGIYQPRRRSC